MRLVDDGFLCWTVDGSRLEVLRSWDGQQLGGGGGGGGLCGGCGVVWCSGGWLLPCRFCWGQSVCLFATTGWVGCGGGGGGGVSGLIVDCDCHRLVVHCLWIAIGSGLRCFSRTSIFHFRDLNSFCRVVPFSLAPSSFFLSFCSCLTKESHATYLGTLRLYLSFLRTYLPLGDWVMLCLAVSQREKAEKRGKHTATPYCLSLLISSLCAHGMNDGQSIGQFDRPFRSTCDIDWPPASRVLDPQLSVLFSFGLHFFARLLVALPWLGRSLILPESHPVRDFSGVCRRMRLSFLILPLFEASRRHCLLSQIPSPYISTRPKLPPTQSLRRLHLASRPISTSASHYLVVKCLSLVTSNRQLLAAATEEKTLNLP
ncbi:hypothetical protein CCUS01_09465 [Colletotrichum cuscutae]|uniref:Uncharacterized protein n=1 Tax=Colletotrichum cuscutae TaxID=1209917 RepID=A0AAI9UJV5_9PEZI|nr:hypothetical protein CCUS01_09465 [Colletotrichum cuscutae]